MANRSPIRRALYYLTGVAPEQPWWTLILFFIGVFGVEIVAAFAGAWLGPRTLLGLPLQVLVPLAAFALVVAGYTAASRVAATRYRLTLALRPPRSHRGLILLLGPYRPLAPLSQPEVERALALIRSGLPGQVEAGLEALELRRSSLWPQLAAIRYHLEGGALRDCWLITTPGGEAEEGPLGAALTVDVLEAYVRRLPGGQGVSLHAGPAYTAAPTAYDAVYEIVDRIFRTAPYRPSHVIADVTGGTKPMTIGIALACLSPGRKMEYMSTDRDWKGEPVPEGELTPVLVDVHAVLERTGAEEDDRPRVEEGGRR
jgi:hypothetical protein